MSPDAEITDASAVGPSSHGRRYCRWSFAETAVKPSRSAVRTYSSRDAGPGPVSSQVSSGR